MLEQISGLLPLWQESFFITHNHFYIPPQFIYLLCQKSSYFRWNSLTKPHENDTISLLADTYYVAGSIPSDVSSTDYAPERGLAKPFGCAVMRLLVEYLLNC